MRTNIELSLLKAEIESIFNPCNIDTDCDTIANLLCSFKNVINEDMSKGNYHQAFDTFLEILDSLSNHFVKDEHFCYFDDIYSPDYTCYDILKSIISQIKTGKSPLLMLLSLIKELQRLQRWRLMKNMAVLSV